MPCGDVLFWSYDRLSDGIWYTKTVDSSIFRSEVPHLSQWFVLILGGVFFRSFSSTNDISSREKFGLWDFWWCFYTVHGAKYRVLALEIPGWRLQDFWDHRIDSGNFELLMERMIPSFLLQPGFISLNWGNRNSKISAPHQPHDINHAQRLFSFFQGHLGDVNSSEAPFLLYMLELASSSVIDSATWRRCFVLFDYVFLSNTS